MRNGIKLSRRLSLRWRVAIAWKMSGESLSAEEPLGCLVAYFPVRLAWFVIALLANR